MKRKSLQSILGGRSIHLSNGIRTLALCVLILPALLACSFPSQSVENRVANITDISGRQTFRTIVNQGFMGGSILYNPDRPSSGQLADGVSVAIRLGQVAREDVGNDQSVFTDLQGKAQYGLLVVQSIDKTGLAFSVSLYDSAGRFLGEKEHTLAENQELDINGDGLADIEYKKPRRKRPGMESAVYLTFLSSQETLNTAMFAVLPEQYSRGVYPSGIIGINPDGRFIFTKYEDADSTIRSMVCGVQKGDFVLDTANGNYQRVVAPSSARSARNLSDTELEDIDTTIQAVYRFSDEEFIDGYDPEILFQQFPEQIRAAYGSATPVIDRLNAILMDRDLIETVSRYQETPIPVELLCEVILQIAILDDDEMLQLNRTFIEELYPEACPRVIEDASCFTEILPLASVIFGDPNKDSYEEAETESRILSTSEYNAQQMALENKFKEYNQIMKYTLSVPTSDKDDPEQTSATFSNSYFALGYAGSFSSCWGSVSTSIEGVVYFNIDTNLRNATSSLSKNLCTIPLFKITHFLNIGPIILNITSDGAFSLPLEMTVDFSASFDGRFAATGLYGAGVSAGLDYGIAWRKVWFFRLPLPYVNWRSGKWAHDTTYFYFGPETPDSALNGLQISLNPNVGANFTVDVATVVGAGISANTGLRTSLGFTYAAPVLTGTAAASWTVRIDGKVFIGLKDIPILKLLSHEWSWNILNYSKPLFTWTASETVI